jgi:hypothetical protein
VTQITGSLSGTDDIAISGTSLSSLVPFGFSYPVVITVQLKDTLTGAMTLNSVEKTTAWPDGRSNWSNRARERFRCYAPSQDFGSWHRSRGDSGCKGFRGQFGQRRLGC